MSNEHNIKHYICPECGPFDVIHSTLAAVNENCWYCGSKVRRLSDEEKEQIDQKALRRFTGNGANIETGNTGQ